MTDAPTSSETARSPRTPLASIVVPAHDEANVIARCLGSALADAAPGEFEVVVVCNGCHDDTAARARAAAPTATIVELATAHKAAALRAGDATATAFPRIYLDADVVVDTRTLRKVAAVLGGPDARVVAAPRAVPALADRPWAVRAFYRVWTSLPFFGPGFVGAGLYALSAIGRRRFGEFPDLIADDGFARLIAAPSERETVDATFTFFPPRTLRAVLAVMTRLRAGRRQLRARFPELLRNETTDPTRTLHFLLRRPGLWLAACVYLPVMALAERRARAALAAAAPVPWHQDTTTRACPDQHLASHHDGP